MQVAGVAFSKLTNADNGEPPVAADVPMLSPELIHDTMLRFLWMR